MHLRFHTASLRPFAVFRLEKIASSTPAFTSGSWFSSRGVSEKRDTNST
jgi:hypothetical protein